MDFIWVPDAGEGNSTGSGKDGNGRLLSPQFVLFLCGFVLLAIGAFMGTTWMTDAATEGERRGLGNLIGMLSFVPTVGFLFQNIAALLGTIKSKAPVAKRFIWFLATQAVACGLLELAYLH